MKLNNPHIEYVSNEKLQLIIGQNFVGQAILVANQLGLFELLCKSLYLLNR